MNANNMIVVRISGYVDETLARMIATETAKEHNQTLITMQFRTVAGTTYIHIFV